MLIVRCATRNYLLSPLITVIFFISLFALHAVAADKPRTLYKETPTTLRPVGKTPKKFKPATISPKKITPLGFCCKDGKISSSTKAACQRERGSYFSTEKEAVLKCTGFCCEDGTVNITTEARCKKKRGLFFGDKRDAENRCAQARGFCCKNGKSSQSTINKCKKKKGTFYPSAREATQKCLGYCCAGFTVSKATQQKCKSSQGKYFTSKQQADRFCESQKGYCCIDGKTSPLTKRECQAKKGEFYSSRESAAKKCKKVVGYCNLNGKTLRLTEDQCNRKKGNYFSNQVLARKNFIKLQRQELAQKKSATKNLPTKAKLSGDIQKKKVPGVASSDLKKSKMWRLGNEESQVKTTDLKADLKLPPLSFSQTTGSAKSSIKTNTSPEASSKNAIRNLQKQPTLKVVSKVTLPAIVFSTEEECRAYARSATDLVDIADRSFCNFQGDAWSPDSNKHFDWCMSVSPSIHRQEAEARLAQFQKCNDCGVYAMYALQQFAQAEGNACNLSGSGWQDDRNAHFDWCMNVSPAERKEENESRIAALQSCGEIKHFAKPMYMGKPLDFCMFRSRATYNEVKVDPGPYSPPSEHYEYDRGWSGNDGPCGDNTVPESFCISQGYQKMEDYKYSDANSSVDTMTIGNGYRCDAEIQRSNCRGFDFINCRKTISGNLATKLKLNSNRSASSLDKKDGLVIVAPEIETAVMQKLSACKIYAEEAVEQVQEAGSAGCDVSGDGWSSDLKKHMDWCMSADSSHLQTERSARQARLQECKECRTYAEKSVAQSHQANTTWCRVSEGGFESGVWHGDMTIHYDWCLAATPVQRQGEIEKREAKLQECSETQRVYIDKPTYGGIRVDIRYKHRNVSVTADERSWQTTADAFCFYKGYGKAVNSSLPSFSSLITETLAETIHIAYASKCTEETINPDKKCEAFDHIICEKRAIFGQKPPKQGFKTSTVTLEKKKVPKLTNVCETYADEAMDLMQQVKRDFYCGGISHQAWIDDRQYLVDWCLSADPTQRQQQSNTRQGIAQRCKDCFIYAQESTRQFHEGFTELCTEDLGYHLPRSLWHADMKEHSEECRPLTPAQLQEKIDERNAQLQQCREDGRKRFEKPVFNGMRINTSLHFFESISSHEKNVPWGAANEFCRKMGYQKAYDDPALQNKIFYEEKLDHTIHLGEGFPECHSSPYPNPKDCFGFNHIICEGPLAP